VMSYDLKSNWKSPAIKTTYMKFLPFIARLHFF
jgi:hypothetical protein